MTDPIADMLTRIRNAVTAKHARVDMPASRLKAEIARILQDEGYIQGFKLLEVPSTGQDRQVRLHSEVRPARRAAHHRACSGSAGPAAASTSAARTCRRCWRGSAPAS